MKSITYTRGQQLPAILEPLTPVLRLAQFETLNHRAHRAIQNGDALFKNGRQLLATGVGDGFHDFILSGEFFTQYFQ